VLFYWQDYTKLKTLGCDPPMKSFVVLLTSRDNVKLPSANGYFVFSMLCEMARGTPLDDIFHPNENPGKKRFSTSFLRLPSNPEISDFGHDLSISKGEYVCFRISFVRDDEADAFAGLISKRVGSSVRLLNCFFRIYDVLRPGQNSLASSVPIGGVTSNHPEGSVGFRFVSPTGFKRNGRQFFLPLPEMVFGDLLRKWALFAGEPPTPNATSIPERIELGRFTIQSHASRLAENRVLRGFCGDVEYDLRNLSSAEQAFALSLATMAFFTGVGYKTTQGMGEVLPYQVQHG
jgi:CRISPR-associated endoribonuclease Cas6